MEKEKIFENDWRWLWEQQAQRSQKPMQMFQGNTQPRTVWQQQIASVDPKCPCQPAHETWAFIEQAERSREKGWNLWVSQPVCFRVLFWYDPKGVTCEFDNLKAKRYCYKVSLDFGHGCSWESLPEKNGEYLCEWVHRATIRPLYFLASLKEAYHTTMRTKKQEELLCKEKSHTLPQ